MIDQPATPPENATENTDQQPNGINSLHPFGISEILTQKQSSIARRLMDGLKRLRTWLLPAGSRRELFFAPFTRHAIRFARVITQSAWYDPAYTRWIKAVESDPATLEKQKYSATRFAYRPLISILVPVYRTPAKILEETLTSVFQQTYPHWEICLVDDYSQSPALHCLFEKLQKNYAQVKVAFHTQNKGISHASNTALALAEGEFVAMLDHDDLLAPHALYEVVKALNANPTIDLFYSDKDMLSANGRHFFSPLFKPDWSPEMMLSANYLTHFNVIRRSLFEQIGGFNPRSDGAQDWDIFLRASEHTQRIAHIPKILYHWRQIISSVSSGIEAKPYAFSAQLYAVSQHLARKGLATKACQDQPGVIRLRTPISTKISILLLSSLHDTCQLLESTGYPNLEVIPPSKVSHPSISQATGDLLLFLNPTLVPSNPDWLEEMAQWLEEKEIGAVGALLCKQDRIQHCGITLGNDGSIAYPFSGWPAEKPSFSPYGSPLWYRNWSALSRDCLMIRRTDLEAIGGIEVFNSVDWDIHLCLNLRSLNKRLVYTPYARLNYPADSSPQFPKQLFAQALHLFQKCNPQGDPYANPNLSLDGSSLRLLRL